MSDELVNLEHYWTDRRVGVAWCAEHKRGETVYSGAAFDPHHPETMTLGDLPPLDPDPLHVDAGDALYWAGHVAGYQSGIHDSLPPRAVTALLAIAAGIVGGLVGFAAGTMT